jgi:hypothetical protein
MESAAGCLIGYSRLSVNQGLIENPGSEISEEMCPNGAAAASAAHKPDDPQPPVRRL